MENLKKFLLRPRYLRAIPSLVVLTTAMAWADAPDTDGMDALEIRTKVSWIQPCDDSPKTAAEEGPMT